MFNIPNCYPNIDFNSSQPTPGAQADKQDVLYNVKQNCCFSSRIDKTMVVTDGVMKRDRCAGASKTFRETMPANVPAKLQRTINKISEGFHNTNIQNLLDTNAI